jgi:uridine kinase
MPRPLFVGVAGGSGSGKTTVVREIVKGVAPVPAGVIHHDAYYRDLGHLPPEERDAVNFDHPDALETSLLVEHLEGLRSGQPVRVPVYDFHTHTRTGDTALVEPTRLVIVDGLLVLADPDLRSLLDLKVFVDTDADIRFIRRLRRDMEERGRSVRAVVEQYQATVRPMHLALVEPSRRFADVIVTEGGYNHAAVDRLVTRLRESLD